MPPDAYRALIAATNMKQRVRKLLEYTWADRLGYAVVGHPEPARVRPGVLRQGRRRAGRREADRAALQGRRCTRWRGSWACPRRSPTRDADDRDVQPAADARRSSTSATRTSGWTCCCGAMTNGVAPAELGAAGRASSRRGRGRLRRDRAPARWRPSYLHAPGRPRRTGRLTCAGSPASCGPAAGRAGRRSDAAADGRRDPAPRARTASGSRSTTAPGLVSTRLAIFDIPRGWQPLRARADGALLVYNGEVYNHPELRAELERAGERVRDQLATPRSCCGCWSATGSARSTA